MNNKSLCVCSACYMFRTNNGESAYEREKGLMWFGPGFQRKVYYSFKIYFMTFK
jgi:hypothetical protein